MMMHMACMRMIMRVAVIIMIAASRATIGSLMIMIAVGVIVVIMATVNCHFSVQHIEHPEHKQSETSDGCLDAEGTIARQEKIDSTRRIKVKQDCAPDKECQYLQIEKETLICRLIVLCQCIMTVRMVMVVVATTTLLAMIAVLVIVVICLIAVRIR